MLLRLKKVDFKVGSLSFATKIVNLHAMLISYGVQRVDAPSYFWDGMKRGQNEFVIWQYTVSGGGVLEYEGREFKLLPGFAMLIHIPHRHKYYFPRDSRVPWDFLYLCMQGREVMRICTELEARNGPIVDHRIEDKTVRRAFEIIFADRRRKGHQLRTSQDASLAAYSIVMSLVDDLSGKIEKIERKPDFIRKVSEFCLENLNSPIGVEDMARIAGYSRYHFSRLFERHTGLSPAKFLKDLRLKKAIVLLQTELLDIKEIAVRCGFNSSSYFCRAFQSAFGVSPDAYRKKKAT